LPRSNVNVRVKPASEGLDAKDGLCGVAQICEFGFRWFGLKGCIRQHRWLSKKKRDVKGGGFAQNGAFGHSKTERNWNLPVSQHRTVNAAY
jgi:hypothetical protein